MKLAIAQEELEINLLNPVEFLVNNEPASLGQKINIIPDEIKIDDTTS